MTAKRETVLLATLAVVAAGVYGAGAMKRMAPSTTEEIPEEVAATPAPEVAAPAPPAADDIPAEVVSKGLPDDGQWRGKSLLVDVNHDGNLDIVTSIRRWSRTEPAEGMYVWLGDGTGRNWKQATEGIRRDMGYGGSAAGDVNGDGHPDLAFSGHDVMPHVFLGDGTGRWQAKTEGILVEGVCSDVALGDVDGDGHTDLLTMGFFPDQGGLNVFSGDGTGETWRLTAELMDVKEFGSHVLIDDIEGDGVVDVVACTSSGVRIWTNDGKGWLTAGEGLAVPSDYPEYIGGSELAIALHDFDGDGVKEILVGGMIYPGHDPLVAYRLEDGVWKRWGKGLPTDEAVFDMAIANVDGSGPAEIVLGARNGITIVRMTATGEFERVGRVVNSGGVINVATGDVDGDGREEILFIGYDGPKVFDIPTLDERKTS